MYSSLESNVNVFSSCCSVSEKDISELMSPSPSKTYAHDPLPTRLLKECIDLVTPTITTLINLSLLPEVVPGEWKDAIILSGLKKRDSVLIFENYRPISNLPFLPKICEKVVVSQRTNHLLINKIMEPFQSVRKL